MQVGRRMRSSRISESNGVVEESLPRSISGTVLKGLGGPPNSVFVVGTTLSASACVAHSCPDKGFFWIDTPMEPHLVRALPYGAAMEEPISVSGANSCGFATDQIIPEYSRSGKQALMEWMNENDIRVKVVRFIDAANKTTELDPADFRLFRSGEGIK